MQLDSIHSFQKLFIRLLLCGGHTARFWVNPDEKPVPGARRAVGEMESKQALNIEHGKCCEEDSVGIPEKGSNQTLEAQRKVRGEDSI